MMSSHPPLTRNMTSYVKLRTYVSTRSKIIGRAKRVLGCSIEITRDIYIYYIGA